MKSKTLADLNLNDAFGFATILAALDGIKSTFAVPLHELDLRAVCLFVYFFIFRMKMFIDDAGHAFKADKPAGFVDIAVALASWVAFLISAAAIGVHRDVSIQWFMVGLAISCVWVVVAVARHGNDETHRYRWFLLFNVLHIVGLWVILQDIKSKTYFIVLGLLMALVVADHMATKEDEHPAVPIT